MHRHQADRPPGCTRSDCPVCEEKPWITPSQEIPVSAPADGRKKVKNPEFFPFHDDDYDDSGHLCKVEQKPRKQQYKWCDKVFTHRTCGTRWGLAVINIKDGVHVVFMTQTAASLEGSGGWEWDQNLVECMLGWWLVLLVRICQVWCYSTGWKPSPDAPRVIFSGFCLERSTNQLVKITV